MKLNSKWADVKEAVAQREVLLAKRRNSIPQLDLCELESEGFQRGPGEVSDELVRRTVRVGDCRIQVNLPAPHLSLGKSETCVGLLI